MSPLELTLEVNPRARVDLIDVKARAAQLHGAALEHYSKCLYVSAHTTAGYLPQPLAARLAARSDGIDSYIDLFRSMFPEGADYAQLHKTYEAEPSGPGRYSPPKVIEVEKTPIFGEPNAAM